MAGEADDAGDTGACAELHEQIMNAIAKLAMLLSN